MAQVRSTYLHPSGQQVNMGDTDTLRAHLDPTLVNDVVNKRYSDAEDLRVANEAQIANDNLEIRINDEIARLDQEDVDLNARIDQEILDRIAGDQAIMDLLNEGGSDTGTKYVERDGDDMLGPLTFGTDKIVLGIDGTGTYAGDVNIGTVEVKSTGQLHITNTVGFGSDKAFTITDNTGESVNITNGGDAYFDQSVRCGAEVYGAYSSFNYKAGRTGKILQIFAGLDTDDTTNAVITLNQDGSGNFAGEVKAEKIDGGIYAV